MMAIMIVMMPETMMKNVIKTELALALVKLQYTGCHGTYYR